MSMAALPRGSGLLFVCEYALQFACNRAFRNNVGDAAVSMFEYPPHPYCTEENAVCLYCPLVPVSAVLSCVSLDLTLGGVLYQTICTTTSSTTRHADMILGLALTAVVSNAMYGEGPAVLRFSYVINTVECWWASMFIPAFSSMFQP